MLTPSYLRTSPGHWLVCEHCGWRMPPQALEANRCKNIRSCDWRKKYTEPDKGRYR